jgi:outer membrane lipoprotein SlyB
LDGRPSVYYDRRDDRSFVEEHRDKLTVAGGTAAGAVVGALVGGKKGAIIGALVGAGGSALYTYGIRDKDDDHGWRR